MEIQRLKFLMDIQEQLDLLEMKFGPNNSELVIVKENFYRLAGKEFYKSVISIVHEQVVEPVIYKQAQEFYTSLKLYPKLFPATQKYLFNDFVQMEHQKRRDDFERFCLCVFQQIELIVNELFERSEVFNKFIIERERLFYSFKKKNTITNEIEIHRGGFSLQASILKKFNKSTNNYFTESEYHAYFSEIKKDDITEISQKFRLITYFFYFNELIFDELKFKKISETFEEIKLIRNKVHRLGKFSNYQNQIILSVEKSKYVCYLKYYGFLVDYLNQISQSSNYSLLNE